MLRISGRDGTQWDEMRKRSVAGSPEVAPPVALRWSTGKAAAEHRDSTELRRPTIRREQLDRTMALGWRIVNSR